MPVRSKARTEWIDLSVVFRPEDEVAVDVARLAILAEDFRVLLTALFPGSEIVPVPGVAGLRKIEWEDMASLIARNLLVTLETARDAIGRISKHAREQPERFQVGSPSVESKILELIGDANKSLNDAASVIANARGKVGGHLDRDYVRRVLEDIPIGAHGMWSWGKSLEYAGLDFATKLGNALFEAALPLRNKTAEPRWADPLWRECMRVREAALQVVTVYILATKRTNDVA